MRLRQTLKVVWANIIGNRMRSFLTMLGMIIGVASVIILVSLMQSFYDSIISSYADMGINNIDVNLMGRNGNLIITESDMYKYAREHSDAIKGVAPNVAVSGTLSKNGEIEEYSSIKGIDENYIKLYNKEIQEGHNITYSDILVRQKVCIIGSYINQKFFEGNAKIGDSVRLNGEEFIIAGILTQISDSSQWSSDNCFYLPYTTAMRLSGMGSVSSYSLYVVNSELVSSETTALQKYLFNTYHDSDAYKVTNLMQMLKESNAQMSILTSVIAGIAGISLVVAGIGIMNIMLVSVSERTREIGIRKSLGAKHKDIMRQFVLEAGVTSTMGGLLGILLGSIVTIKAGDLLKLKAMPNLNTVLVAFCISVGIGILFGYLPARKAAKLNPIDALRSE
ncbi:MAG: ABC transporter permease [Herbinix sp.]|nr:ABC transporter permease [Herbinix sp.]